jgi:hypothetical protein
MDLSGTDVASIFAVHLDSGENIVDALNVLGKKTDPTTIVGRLDNDAHSHVQTQQLSETSKKVRAPNLGFGEDEDADEMTDTCGRSSY